MPSTEDRINERERVRAGNRDYSNPFVHLREIVVDETKALAKIGLVVGIFGSAKDREEMKARASVLKMVMERFPEIDWGGPVCAQPTGPIPTTPFPQPSRSDPAMQTGPIPTGDLAMVPPPMGFTESCDCPACSEYRTFRDRTVN